MVRSGKGVLIVRQRKCGDECKVWNGGNVRRKVCALTLGAVVTAWCVGVVRAARVRVAARPGGGVVEPCARGRREGEGGCW